MGPNAGIPVKTGRLCTGAYLRYNPITADPNDVNNNPGALNDPGDVKLTALPTGPGGINTRPDPIAWASPMVDQFNTCTIEKQDASVHLNNLFKYTPKTKPSVSPTLRSALPMREVKPLVHMAYGGSPNLPSDSAFHPINQPAPIPKINSARAGERQTAPSFESHNNMWWNPNNSFYKDQVQIGSDRVGVPRWQTVKKGAV